jgi:hypothetical protein
MVSIHLKHEHAVYPVRRVLVEHAGDVVVGLPFRRLNDAA